MEKKKRFSFAITIILLFTCVTIYYIIKNDAARVDEIPGGIKITSVKKTVKTKQPSLQIKSDFHSNEEIKREYGRLELVTLFTGEKYEGAVVSIDDSYTIVTVRGLVKIPMENVKSRMILNFDEEDE